MFLPPPPIVAHWKVSNQERGQSGHPIGFVKGVGESCLRPDAEDGLGMDTEGEAGGQTKRGRPHIGVGVQRERDRAAGIEERGNREAKAEKGRRESERDKQASSAF